MFIVRGKIDGPKGADWAGHRVEFRFGERVSVNGAGPVVTRRLVSAEPDDEAAFALTLPSDSADVITGPFLLRVAAPDGTGLASKEFTREQLGQEPTIQASPITAFTIAPSADPALGRLIRLAGRVIDDVGREVAPGLPVLLWGVPQAEGAEPEPRPVVLSRTQAGGYFGGTWVPEPLTSAFGTVAGGPPIPVRLEDGRLPTRVVLVTRLSEADIEDADCACETGPPLGADPLDVALNPEGFAQDLGGTCTTLTQPNRAIEEFTYEFVVRTSDPQIRGTTLAPRRPVPASVLTDFKRIAGVVALPPPIPGPSGPSLTAGDAEPRAASNGDRAGDQSGGDEGNGDARPGTEVTLRAALAEPVTDATTIRSLLRRPGSLTADVFRLEQLTHELKRVVDVVDVARRAVPGRVEPTADNQIDWDDTPTINQATTVAHGHILSFKQVFRNDGYSMGDLVHSIPLAPGQQRLVSVLDWDRRTSTSRTESMESEERLDAMLSRDRDITEIAGSRLTEEISGGSSASQWGVAGGIGAGFIGSGFGIFGGVAGGASGADADSWQDSARSLTADALQSLSDRTSQRASAVRDQRSTVVQSVTQGETVRAETEQLANYNHCHAITVQYFEVLRHLLVSHELAQVRECLFVPFPITLFTVEKARRWREPLARFLRNRALSGAFEAVERVARNWEGYDVPEARFSQEAPESLTGEMRVSFVLPRPRDAEDGTYQVDMWRGMAPFLSTSTLELWTAKLAARSQAERDLIFRREVAPGIAAKLVQALKFAYVTTGGAEVPVDIDPTLVSRYEEGVGLYVSLRPSGVPATPREEIARFKISYDGTDLPPEARVVVESAKVRYRSPHLEHLLFDRPRLLDDLTSGDPVVIPTPLARAELRDPRADDRLLAERLVAHLNENLEYYHQAIWASMDNNRRFMLLDGVIAPNSGGRSVASVVENRVIGVVGNSLVLPVAPGVQLDPTLDRADERLALEHAYAADASPPIRISLPTRGVYAEAIAGSCNACEVIDDSRYWRWEESPLPEQPSEIAPLSLDSRAVPETPLTPTPLPQPIVAIQNAPTLPDPVGLQAALQLLAKGDIFRDATGLAATQKNALAAFKGAMDTAKFLGGEAAKIAQQQALSGTVDRTLSRVDEARAAKLITDEQARDLTAAALRAAIGAAPPAEQPPTTDPSVKKVLDAAAQAEKADVTVTTPGETVEAGFEGTVGTASVIAKSETLTRYVKLPIKVDEMDGGVFTVKETITDIGHIARMITPVNGGLGQVGAALLAKGQVVVDPADPATFRFKTRYRITWPEKAGVVEGTALPVVVLLHGQFEHYKFTWSSTPVGTVDPPGGPPVKIFNATAVTETDSFLGFQYLQDALAKLGIVSISVDCNFANFKDLGIETRAELVWEALFEIARLGGTSGHRLNGKLALNRVGLIGHSRGGDAVVRAPASPVGVGTIVEVRAICPIAPTDMTGTSGPATAAGHIGRVVAEGPNLDFFLVLYGAQDGDVSGVDGARGEGGNGFRHYDRAKSAKAMAYLDGIAHDRFNQKWPEVDPMAVTGTGAEAVRPRTAHQAVAVEYIGGLLDAVFHPGVAASATKKQLLNGTKAGTSGVPASIQFAFGSEVITLDDFEGAAPQLAGLTRTVSASGPGKIEEMANVATATSPDRHTGHQTKVLRIDKASGATAALELVNATPQDWDRFTWLTLSFGGRFPFEPKTAIASAPLPDLKITLVDEAGGTKTLTRSAFENPAVPGRPAFHEIRFPPGSTGTPINVTLIRLETARVPMTRFEGVNRKKIKKIIIEPATGHNELVFVDALRLVTP
ncbi:MAG: hypothetical protein GEV11_12135 [Streptosporangiales bacterium]|nr:hypothetical protein [Streptosporangiales bacterium]